ncbi:hypothetical protein LCGC14_0962830 [marine sediment metagenome]|uniref:Uncharacterized protein n=1 Tax=marine sediment metagenome TaxID=412755 RepID=A0A0F9NE21_9ZZZZ
MLPPLLKFYANELRSRGRALAAIAFEAVFYVAVLALLAVAAQQVWVTFVI